MTIIRVSVERSLDQVPVAEVNCVSTKIIFPFLMSFVHYNFPLISYFLTDNLQLAIPVFEATPLKSKT